MEDVLGLLETVRTPNVDAFVTHSIADTRHGTLGTEFVFTFPRPVYPETKPIVMISTPSTDTVTFNLSISGIGYEYSGTTTRNKHADIYLPTTTYLDLVDSIQEKTVLVLASAEVSVYGLSGNPAGDGFNAIPSYAFGKKYFGLTFKGCCLSYPGELAISAVEDKTEVQVNLPNAQIINFTLNAFQSFLVIDGGDLTESVIQANKAIAVMAGTSLSTIGKGLGGPDGLLEQLPPVESYGYNFILTPFQGRPETGYVYRVITPKNASITISNNGVVKLQAGKMYEDEILDDSIIKISSDTPVLVMQYSKSEVNKNGDPAMSIIPPTELFSGNVTFPRHNSWTYRINIVVKCSHAQGLTYDDSTPVTNFETLILDDMCVYRNSVPAGTHSVGHIDPDVTFFVLVYGLHYNHVAMYPAGFNVRSGELN